MNKYRWGIDNQVLSVPIPREQQWWEEHVYEKGEDFPRIKLVNSDVYGIPTIPQSRHYILKNPLDFQLLLQVVNDFIGEFIDMRKNMKQEGLIDNDKLQELICEKCVGLLHRYTPNFMSFIGAQYLQRICVEKEDTEYSQVDDDKPRSYYAFKYEYFSAINSSEKKLIGSFVEVFGSLFFASKAYVCAFVGEPGCGKNYLKKIAVNIAGGQDYVYLLDERYNNFSLSSHSTSTNCLCIVEDAGNTQTEIPRTFKDAMLGVGRDSKGEGEFINVDEKFKTPKRVSYQ